MKKAKQSNDFEKSLAQLEKIVERMEKGDQTLNQSLKDFEQGMQLSEECQQSLNNAQLRVEKLVQKHQHDELQLLDPNNDEKNLSYDED